MKTVVIKAVLVMTLGLVLTACSSLGAKNFNIYLDNDTSRDIYDPRVTSDDGRYLIIHSKNFPLISRGSTNAHGISVRSIPKELTVRWKEYLQGPWIERRIAVREVLGRDFDGITFVSILEDGSLALSWEKRNRKMTTVGCGGYIYETYYDRAKPRIERNLEYSRRAYLKRKEVDLAAGKTGPYKKDGYPDSLSEIAFKCDFMPYMQE